MFIGGNARRHGRQKETPKEPAPKKIQKHKKFLEKTKGPTKDNKRTSKGHKKYNESILKVPEKNRQSTLNRLDRQPQRRG